MEYGHAGNWGGRIGDWIWMVVFTARLVLIMIKEFCYRLYESIRTAHARIHIHFTAYICRGLLPSYST